MGGRFRVEWDDFSGGFYVGGNDASQPMNTYRGIGAMSGPWDSLVGPAPKARLVWQHQATDSTREFVLGGAKGVGATPSTGAGISTDILGVPVARCSDGRLGIRTFDVINGVENSQVAQDASALAGNVWTSGMYPYFRGNDKCGFAVAGDFRGATRPNFAGVSVAGFYIAYFQCELGAAQIACGSVPEEIHTLARWNNRFYGASATNDSRLWFTDASGTSMTSGNFIDIDGQAGEPITALVPSLSGLYIGKPSGWWLLTGVPGATAFVQDLGNISIGPRSNHAAASEYGIMFSEPHIGTSIVAQNGNDLRTIVYERQRRNYSPTHSHESGARGPVPLGSGAIAAIAQPPPQWTTNTNFNGNLTTTDQDYGLIFERGRWRQIPSYTTAPMPYTTGDVNQPTVYGDGTGGSRVPTLVDFMPGFNSVASLMDNAYGYMLVADGSDAPASDQRGWEVWAYPLYRPPWGTFQVWYEQQYADMAECTVELAEWRKASQGNQAMTCSLVEAYVEVEKLEETYDPSPGAGGPPLDSVCFIELRVRTRGIVGEQTGVDGGYSTSDRWEAPASVLGGDLESQRQFVRLGVTSGLAQSFSPEVTLHGLRLRRLILVMADGATP